MMRSYPTLFPLLLIILAIALAQGLKIDDQLEMNLELIKHQPCNFRPGKSKWSRKLEFETGDDKSGPMLIARPSDGPNCYSIDGKVNVFSEFKGDFSIYLEMRSSVNKRQVPEACNGQSEDGCGGFGSCLYCNVCQTLTNIKGVRAQLLLDNHTVSCTGGLRPGAYDNIQLAFCMPDLKDILNSQGMTVEQCKDLVQSEEGQTLRSMGLFVSIYVFDTDVRKLMQTQNRVEQIYRRSKKGFVKEEPLPPDVYWSLPFNSLLKEQKQFVACHKIYGNVKIRPL